MSPKIRHTHPTALMLVSAVLVLTACGGGGSDSPPAAAPAPVAATSTAEGLYLGTITGSLQNTAQFLVLEDGQYWGVYGRATGNITSILGFVQGRGTTSGSTFSSSSGFDYSLSATNVFSLTSTFVPLQTLSGQMQFQTGSFPFNLTALTSGYTYNSPPSLTPILGTWTGTAISGQQVLTTIAADGTVTATSGGCTVSGRLSPRPSGKNVYNFSATAGAAPCSIPGATVSGIGYHYATIDQKRQVVLLGLIGATSTTFSFLGLR